MDSASSLTSTTPNLPTQDAENGIGPIKSVLSAQRIGSSILTEFVSLLAINVPLTMLQELALLAMLDTT